LVLALKKGRSGRIPPRISPRKEPGQARSRETVDAILRATAHILVKDGYEGMTTNKVALKAGVSVGSLYQYFPGKEALVAALVDRHQAEVLEAMSPDPELLTLPLDELVPKLIEAMLRAHGVDPPLHKVLLEVAPRLGKPPHALRDRGVSLVSALLELHKREVRALDVDLTAFIVVQTVESLCHEATLSRPDLLKDPRLVKEMSQLLLRYVRR
jgi:AcrR family transcriptional regulator